MSSPRRIQRRRTKGWRMPEGAVYVGRPSPWGNPYRPTTRGAVLGRMAAEQAVRAFRRALLDGRTVLGDAPLRALLEPLRGRDLVCWCPLCDRHQDGRPLGVECPDCPPCHADYLGELANRAQVTS